MGYNRVDDRLVGWADVMPTLLDLAGIDIPETVEGVSMVGEQKRDWFYGEVGEDNHATRMIRDGRYKLIYYPVGNCRQLFDLQNDPDELIDLSTSAEHADILTNLTDLLIGQLYGGDEAWAKDGQLIGRTRPRLYPRSQQRTLQPTRFALAPAPAHEYAADTMAL